MLRSLKTTVTTETVAVETTMEEAVAVVLEEATIAEVQETTTELQEAEAVVVKEEENLLAVEEAATGIQPQADAHQEGLILRLLEREDQEEAKNYFI